MIAITANEEPGFAAGSEQTFYGTLTGYHEIENGEDTEKIPSFELLFWE